jgi:hypothetical protein
MRAMPSGCTDAASRARAHTRTPHVGCMRATDASASSWGATACAPWTIVHVRIRAPVRIRYSVVMSSLPGESVSCGNLGVISAKKEDAATAKAKQRALRCRIGDALCSSKSDATQPGKQTNKQQSHQDGRRAN